MNKLNNFIQFLAKDTHETFTINYTKEEPFAILKITRSTGREVTEKQKEKYQQKIWKARGYKFSKVTPFDMADALAKTNGEEFTHFALMTNAATPDKVAEWKLHFQRLLKEGRIQKVREGTLSSFYKHV